MRRSLPFLVLLLATAASCSQVSDNGSAPPAGGDAADAAQTANTAESDMAVPGPIPPELPAPRARPDRQSGPGIDPESAPGVAFDYRYSFRLEADRIAEMQQEHQRLCERYARRCRITGMDYRAANADDVEAMLSFLVDPAIAGQFGRESVRAVEGADGELTESDISGTDVGTALKVNTGSLADLQAELERIEARLAQGNVPRSDRSRLQDEAQMLRRQIAALRATTDDQERSLATTPMLFRYGSGSLAPGPGRQPTVSEAFERSTDNFIGGLNILLIIFVTISPWLLTGLLGWWGFTRVRRRLVAARPAGETESAA